jgi:peptide/nickel transport system permease protein
MRLLTRRIGFYILTAWVGVTVAFIVPRLAPGNPAAVAVGEASAHGYCPPACVTAIYSLFGQGQSTSVLSQYFSYLGNLFHGNLGYSWSENAPVTQLVVSYLPWTLGLLGVATVLSFLLGTLLGVAMAWRRGSALDWLMPAATFFQAIPYFFLAEVLILVLGTTGTMLKWFPSFGGYDLYTVSAGMNWPYISSIIGHAVLPGLTVTVASMAGFIMGMRNQMVTTMDEDFVLVARAKGLPPSRVVWYAARNALLPSISNFTIALSLVVAGQFLVEYIFNYPGIGFHLIDAISHLDYALVQGIFVVVILVVLLANLLADVVYVLIDPRVRQEA